MKNSVIALAVLTVGISCAVFLAIGKPKPQTQPVMLSPAPLVEVLNASYAPIRLHVETQGTVRPHQEIDIVSRVAGLIEDTHKQFAEGAFVSKGEVLLKIEDADYRFALIRSQAKVAEAQQLLATERARAAQAQKEWHDLGQSDANDLFLRKPQLASAQAQLLAARADRDAARLNLTRTQIQVPFDSRIREKYVDKGQYVSAGTPIARLYATSKVEVRLPLTDKQLALIELPDPLSPSGSRHPDVTLKAVYAGKSYQWYGKLMRTEASIDTNSRVSYVIVEVANPFAGAAQQTQAQQTGEKTFTPLTIGLFVEAEIQGQLLNDAIELPRMALQVDQQILTLDDNDHLRFKQVEILQADPQRVIIRGDINPGERIVVSNLPMAIEGMQVTPRPYQPDSQTPVNSVP
jgi:RND family efflux transporter MFP subunit